MHNSYIPIAKLSNIGIHMMNTPGVINIMIEILGQELPSAVIEHVSVGIDLIYICFHLSCIS